MRKITILVGFFAFAATSPGGAFGQHAGDIEIGSSAADGGSLVMEYPFTETPIVRVSDSGFPGLFTSQDPGFEAVESDGPGLFVLDSMTEVSIEIIAVDDGVSLFIDNGVDPPALLAAPGDSARLGVHEGTPELHRHPGYQLLLAGAPDEFAEGNVYFKLKNTAGPTGYGDSEVRRLKLSNGYLPALETPTKDDAKCQQAVGKNAGRLVAKNYKLMAKCFDKLAASEAGGSEKAALSACTLATLAAGFGSNTQAANDKIGAKCGPLSASSSPFTQVAVTAHLGMANCRVQELISAGYNGAFERLAELLLNAGQIVAEEELAGAFPCLHNSAGD
jgi:hypothetical protein